MSFDARGPVRTPIGGDGLADVLERVLEKGVVIAGDVAISLVGIELLTIRLRLLIASVDKARELGINWWEGDPGLSGGAQKLRDENAALRARIEALEARLPPPPAPMPPAPVPDAASPAFPLPA